ncbi:MAG: ribosomal large subunit pseudouridine synthase B, partial [Thiohalomonadales bacterium]
AKFNRIIDTGGDGANHWYRVTLNEGRNREVRRLWESQGLTVSRLSRIKFGPIVLQKKLRRGEYEEIGLKQLQELYATVGMSVPKDPAAARTKRNNKYRKLR